MRTSDDFNLYYATLDPWRILRARFRDRVLRRCLTRFIRGKSVLELGCGEGHLTQAVFYKGWRSLNTTTWSRHSLRIEPISLSAYPFCQGERGDVGRSRIPIDRSLRIKTSP